MTGLDGEARRFFMATCQRCDLAMPFYDEAERDDWARGHCAGTGHDVIAWQTWRRIVAVPPPPTGE